MAVGGLRRRGHERVAGFRALQAGAKRFDCDGRAFYGFYGFYGIWSKMEE